MKLFKIFFFLIVNMIPFESCAQILEGFINDSEIEKVTLVFCPNGIDDESQYIDAVVKNGHFEFNIESMPVNETDVVIIVGRHKLGAHLLKDNTLQIDIKKSRDGYTVSFSGLKDEESRFYNRYVHAYNIMRYFSFSEEEEEKSVTAFLQLLTSEYENVKAMLPIVSNPQNRTYYARLNESKYKSLQAYIIANHLRKIGLKAKDNSEYVELLKDVDINDDIHRTTGLAQKALLIQIKSTVEPKSDATPFCMELMQFATKKVTNPLLYRELVRTVGNYYFSGDGSGDNMGFWKAYNEFAGPDNSDIPLKYVAKLERFEKFKRGKKAYDITLTDRDGKTVQLFDLALGKLTYIDIWATWCGPCLIELPYMEKLVEKYKDNPKVQFISISVDKDIKAWKEKIDKDQPQWAQYYLKDDMARQFSKDWDITSIPRFIFIDKNCNIYSADASRPSSSTTEAIIIEETR